MVLFAQTPRKSTLQKNTSIETITFERLRLLMQPNPDTVRIINFWATTCRPCVEEMPSFERVHREYSVPPKGQKPVQVLFVSLDFKRDVETKVIPFVKKRGLSAPVVFWGMPKSAEIDGVDSAWSGSIPATLIVGTKKGERAFYEKKIEYEELKDFVKTYLFP
jgi:thiol-disulfide isomerase/thioredoxin